MDCLMSPPAERDMAWTFTGGARSTAWPGAVFWSELPLLALTGLIFPEAGSACDSI